MSLIRARYRAVNTIMNLHQPRVSNGNFKLSVDGAEITIQITGTFSRPSLSVDEATVTIA